MKLYCFQLYKFISLLRQTWSTETDKVEITNIWYKLFNQFHLKSGQIRFLYLPLDVKLFLLLSSLADYIIPWSLIPTWED